MTVEERRKKVIRLWRQGLTASKIATRLGASRATVSMDIHYLREVGHDLPKRRGGVTRNPDVTKRRKAVRTLWEQGMTSREIALQLDEGLGKILTDIRWLRVKGEASRHLPSERPERRERRGQVERLWREGVVTEEIAVRIGIRRSTVYEDIRRLREEGRSLPHRIPALAKESR
jgi:DNA-binding CsgD family transcriptional regulator